MREIRLKAFAHVNFNKSEKTHFAEFIKTKYGSTIQKGEGVLFISLGETMYQFVEPPEEWDSRNGNNKKVRVKVIASQRFRIEGTKWSVQTLQYWAERAGYRIIGIKRFEWYLKERILEAAKEVKKESRETRRDVKKAA